jgi:hypothetical protein
MINSSVSPFELIKFSVDRFENVLNIDEIDADGGRVVLFGLVLAKGVLGRE